MSGVFWVGVTALTCPACSGSPSGSDASGIDLGGSDVDEQAEVRFENLRVEELAARRAVVRFDTSVPTTCEVAFGTSEDALVESATDPNMAEGETTTAHEVPLEDLQPETTYFWQAVVVDATDLEWRSDVGSFTTTVDEATAGLQNFALGATVVSVSSNFGSGDHDSTWGANKAFDGQMTTEWATNGDGNDAEVTVDFGFVRKVTHFAYRSREMTDGTSIVTKVQLRFDDGEPVGPFATPDPDVRYEFRLEQGVASQRATLEVVESSGGNTGAREIEYIGTPKE